MSHWNGKLWYAYGTSMTSVQQGQYVPVVEKLSGLKAVNHGIPGGSLTPDGLGKGNIKRAVTNMNDGKDKAVLPSNTIANRRLYSFISGRRCVYKRGGDCYAQESENFSTICSNLEMEGCCAIIQLSF